MKKPQNTPKAISCVCGANYEVHTAISSSKIDICANCHPFYTNKERKIDRDGRIQKFEKKYGKNYLKK